MKSRAQANDPGKRPEEDTEAILGRRRFLIASALAGAGIGIALSGCPMTCLSYAPNPRPCLEVAPPEPEPEPQVCLEVEPPEPQVCLQPLE